MKNLISKPWFLAILALALMLGTQAGAYLLYKDTLFPPPKDVLVIKRADPSPIEWSFSSDDLVKLKMELVNRLSEVEAREAELNVFEARIQSDRDEINAIKAEVERMRDTLLADIVEVEEWEKKNLKTLADTYSNLDPDATVNIFGELDDATVAKILKFMDPATIGEILQEMANRNGGAEDELIKRAAKLSNMLRLSVDGQTT